MLFYRSNRPTPAQAPLRTSPLRLGTENRPPARPSSSSMPTAQNFTFYPPQQQFSTPFPLHPHHISHRHSEHPWQPPARPDNALPPSSAPVYPSQPHYGYSPPPPPPPPPPPDDFSAFILPLHPSVLHSPLSPSFPTGSVDLYTSHSVPPHTYSSTRY